MSSRKYSQPSSDVIEISIFGPKYGESIVVHTGRGRWIIVDSCLNDKQEPAALQYFREMSVTPSEAIDLIVSTHWHDDHTKGLTEILRQSKQTKIACTSAKFAKDLRAIHRAFVKKSAEYASPANEQVRLFEFCKQNGVKLIQVIQDRELKRKINSDSHLKSLIALSPTDDAILETGAKIGKIISDLQEPRKVSGKEINVASTVLRFCFPGFSILLGSDMENHRSGWDSILESEELHPEHSQIFKIPHHGAESGFHGCVWVSMLNSNPVSVVTPFVQGNLKLPTLKDIERICSITNQGFLTSGFQRTRIRDRRKRKILDFHSSNHVEKFPNAGHIRIRIPLSKPEQISVGLFGTALSLNEVLGAK